MSISIDTKAELLVEHYEHTCKDVKEQIILRERLFLFVLVLIALTFFQIADPEQSSKVAVSVLEKSLETKVNVNASAITAVLWFLLLSVTVRYFQANVYIDRRYKYLHKMEEDINILLSQSLINREGKSYLKNYPLFSSWIHILYTWIFPIGLLLTVSAKYYLEWPGYSHFSGIHFAQLLIFLAICISVFLYLLFLHKRK